MVVHPQGEAKALAGMSPSPTVPPIRHNAAITQLPVLEMFVTLPPHERACTRDPASKVWPTSSPKCELSPAKPPCK